MATRKQPAIFVIDDDEQVLRAIARDLRNEYKKTYRIVSTTSAGEALAMLKDLKAKNEPVALFVSDQRMPEMNGVDFLEQTKPLFPEAKRVLLTAYSETSAAIKAINDVKLDYYLLKPWDPPEEKLFPVLTDLLGDWQATYRPEFDGIKLAGYQFSPKSHDIKDFLASNLFPYQWLDIEANDKAGELLTLHQLDLKDLPVVFFEDGSVLSQPSLRQIADKIGLAPKAVQSLYDVVIIGAGPAGLAAAVYGASEGLKTLLIERRAPGGQAGTSSRIENYLGFPTGLSGADLSRRAITQAQRLGAEFLVPQEVADLTVQDHYKLLTLSDGVTVTARSVVIATGVEYRKLEAKGTENFTGAGVYYGAATTEAAASKGKDVYIVGGGNSAGQAAMFFSQMASRVFIVIRRDSLSATMSQYLIDQIGGTPNIELVSNSEIIEVCGGDRLDQLVLQHIETKATRTVPAAALFVFIGAKPVTDWLKLDVIKDKRGFIETGKELFKYSNFKETWKHEREPFP
ncbi:MAG: FAD-dependent oxidoreductase, partial [Rhizobacter sp.]|nr:FAD-dependent oxidoreductase [Chlorobiales bacterium]